MPIYDYECPECGRRANDVWAKINETALPCAMCEGMMIRLMGAPAVHGDLEPYLEENMGHTPVYIKSKQHRRDELRRRGLRIRGE